MPNNINGFADVESYGNSATVTNIASSTDATPIVVTTSAAHGLNTGDVARIAGHAVNVAANGQWFANVLTSTTFQLLALVTHANSVGSGAGNGGATGTCIGLNWTALTQVPSDGDNVTAASVLTIAEAAVDRTATVAEKLAYTKQIAFFVQNGASVDAMTTWATATTGTANSWYSVASLGSIVSGLNGDTIEVDFTGTVNATFSGANFTVLRFGLFAVAYDPGTSPSFPTGATTSALFVGGSTRIANTSAATQYNYNAVNIHGTWPLSAAHGRSVQIYLGVWDINPNATTVNMVGDWNATIKVLR